MGEVFNIGSGFDLDVLSIARKIVNLVGKSDDLIHFRTDRSGQVQHHLSSTEKAESVLNIQPGRSFEEGLQETIEWYDLNREWWKPLEWMKEVIIRTKSGDLIRW